MPDLPPKSVRLIAYVIVLLSLGMCWARSRDDSTQSCDAACVALGQATKHAREDYARARAASIPAETVYVARRVAVGTAKEAVAKAETPRDSIVALLHTVAVMESALQASDSMLARFRVERVAADSLVHSLDRENVMLRAQVRALQPGRVALFIRRTLPVVAFIGGVYAGSRVVR